MVIACCEKGAATIPAPKINTCTALLFMDLWLSLCPFFAFLLMHCHNIDSFGLSGHLFAHLFLEALQLSLHHLGYFIR